VTSPGKRLRVYPIAGGAFTLVEMVLVTVLIGLLAGIAVPKYANFIAEQRVEAAARRVAVDMALAQREAKFASAPRTVQFDVAAGSYRLVGMADPDHPNEEYVVELDDEPYAATIASASFGGQPSVTFDAYGSPQQTGSVVVRVGSRERTVAVSTGDLILGPRRKFSEMVSQE
jgi:type II secretory pathway pseudopilin PulG